jgi:hypothetical protein
VPAVIGFAVIAVATALPWARFNDPRIFGAWTWGWPALAPLGGLAGLAVVSLCRLRPIDPRIETPALAALAVIAAGGAVVYRLNPPLLDGSSLAPLGVVAGAILVLAAAVQKSAVILLRR